MMNRTKRLATLERDTLDSLPDEALEKMWHDFKAKHPEATEVFDAIDAHFESLTDDELDQAVDGIPLPRSVLDRLGLRDDVHAETETLLVRWGLLT
jgi:hypothetical protein